MMCIIKEHPCRIPSHAGMTTFASRVIIKKFLFVSIFIAFFSLVGIKNSNAQDNISFDRVIATNTIKCGYMIWPPYFNKDLKTGEISGVSKDYSDLVFSLLNLKVEYVEVILGQHVQDLMNHKIDAMCFDGPATPPTMKKQSFATPIFYSPTYAYARANDNRFKKLEDLNTSTTTFAGIDGDLSQHLAVYTFPKAKLQSYPGSTDPSQMFINLTTKKADIFLTDPLTAKNFMTSNPEQVAPLFSNHSFAQYPFSFSVSKDEPKLLELLNGGVAAAQNMGLMEPILAKYDPDGTFMIRPIPPYQTGHAKTP